VATSLLRAPSQFVHWCSAWSKLSPPCHPELVLVVGKSLKQVETGCALSLNLLFKQAVLAHGFQWQWVCAAAPAGVVK
jgi:hypothetical protein